MSTSIVGKLSESFKKPQWNLSKVDAIGAWQKCPLYEDVHFIESPSKNISVMTFQIPIYWRTKRRKD